MMPIVLIGAGGHCRSVIDVIEQNGQYKIAGIVDNSLSCGTNVLGYSILGNDEDLPKIALTFKYALISVGQIKSASLRIRLFNLALKAGFELPSIISPLAYVSKHASIGKGVVVMHNALINSNAIIGDNCIVNSKALVEHDCEISNHCHISTNAIINGGVQIGSESFIGSGVITKQSITINKNSFIKAGSIVT